MSPLSEEARRKARRTFLAGSLAAPLITTLASRPAWAGCGMNSALASGMEAHASHATEIYCEGMPATYWRTTPEALAQHVTVGPLNPKLYSNLTLSLDDYTYATKDDIQGAMPGENEYHHGALLQYKEWLKDYPTFQTDPFGTKFQYYFTMYPDPYLTIMQALWLDNDQLICQSACAWVNANQFPATFGYSPQEVVALYETNEFGHLVEAFTIMNSASVTV